MHCVIYFIQYGFSPIVNNFVSDSGVQLKHSFAMTKLASDDNLICAQALGPSY